MANETKAAHTPGKWKWGEEKPMKAADGATEMQRELFGEGGCDSILFHAADWSISDANARLIALSPEMLAALEDMVQMILLYTLISVDSPTLKRAQAAIAKVNGE